jgi:hypothetical protein
MGLANGNKEHRKGEMMTRKRKSEMTEEQKAARAAWFKEHVIVTSASDDKDLEAKIEAKLREGFVDPRPSWRK